jgi:hypothetical protein
MPFVDGYCVLTSSPAAPWRIMNSSDRSVVIDLENLVKHPTLIGGLFSGLAVAAVLAALPSQSRTTLLAAQAPEPSADWRDTPIVLSEDLQKLVDSGTAMNPQKTVFLDKKNNRVLLTSRVCLREGLLEMLLCKAKTKEHESVITIDSDAFIIHGALLALGAEPGHPVRFQPEFQPPEGAPLEVWLNWTDAAGKPQRTEAQKWVRHLTRRYYVEKIGALPKGLKLAKELDLKYDPSTEELIWFGPMTDAQRDGFLALTKDKTFQAAINKMHTDSQSRQMEADFIFGGSGFHTAKDGTKHYQAEGGNVICVANFGDAMIDVSVRSSERNDEASFEPYTDRIPALGTPVIVELIPAKSKPSPDKEPAGKTN